MDVVITAGDDTTALHSLYEWLSEDSDMVRAADVAMGSTPGTGQMGALDILNVALPNMVALGTLVSTYAMWRKGRQETADITISINGGSISVRNASPETLGRILALAEMPADR
jgi:hypothetical protein